MSLKAILKYSAADPDPENSGQGDTVFAKVLRPLKSLPAIHILADWAGCPI
jgi:hypothetical protein